MRWVTEVFFLVVVLSVTTGARRRQTIKVMSKREGYAGTSQQSGSMTSGVQRVFGGGAGMAGSSMSKQEGYGVSSQQSGSMTSGVDSAFGGGGGFAGGGSSIFFNNSITSDEVEIDMFNKSVSLWNTTSKVQCFTNGIPGFNFRAMSEVMETMSTSVVQVMKFLSNFQSMGAQLQNQMSQYDSKLTEIDYKIDQIVAAPGSQSIATQEIQQLTERVDVTVQMVTDIREIEEKILNILVNIQGGGGGGGSGGGGTGGGGGSGGGGIGGGGSGGGGSGRGGGSGGGGSGGGGGGDCCGGRGSRMAKKLNQLEVMLQEITSLIQTSNQEQITSIRQISSEVATVVETVQQLTTTVTGNSPLQDTSAFQQIVSQAFEKFQETISHSFEQITSIQQSVDTIISSGNNFGSLSTQFEAMASQMASMQSMAESILKGIINLSKKRCSVSVDGKFTEKVNKFVASNDSSATMITGGNSKGGLWFTSRRKSKKST